MKIDLEYAEFYKKLEELSAWKEKAEKALETLKGFVADGSQPVGWLTLPEDYDKDEIARIRDAAARIRQQCEVFVVIGVGGSYLGARSAMDFLWGKDRNAFRKEGPAICFAGTDLDGEELARLLEYCKGKSVCVNVISKSGTTTEPAVAFRFFRGWMEEKYGKEAASRIFVTTDERPRPGTLKELALKEGYECFKVPGNIGGRYSVLSAVGLLPIAVSGADLGALLDGAAKAKEEFINNPFETNLCMQYAAMRNLFYNDGKKLELFSFFRPAADAIGEWLKQLFAESEGKEGKGIYPCSAVYTRDLHSIGQYVQEGERMFFETMVLFDPALSDPTVPNAAENVDGLNYLAGKNLSYINDNAAKATCLAHSNGGVPVLCLRFPRPSEECLGYLYYFFELACALSGTMLGINPFDQPGVEQYKTEMFRNLGKPGYTK